MEIYTVIHEVKYIHLSKERYWTIKMSVYYGFAHDPMSLYGTR